MTNLIEAENLCKEYTLGKGNTQQVLKDCSLSVQEGEFLAVMGASGSGKSTLLYNISGMDRCTKGRVSYHGKDISAMKEEELAAFRLEKMGFVFQQNHFLKNLNILDNIILPACLSKKISRADMNTRASALMEQMDISQIKDKDITQVSGGQLQRASICRALINQPQILFGDEPTGALNSRAAGEVLDILQSVNAMGTTIMLVTHDPRVAARTERVLFMSDGIIAGELYLGKYDGIKNLRERESRLADWLLTQDF